MTGHGRDLLNAILEIGLILGTAALLGWLVWLAYAPERPTSRPTPTDSRNPDPERPAPASSRPPSTGGHSSPGADHRDDRAS